MMILRDHDRPCEHGSVKGHYMSTDSTSIDLPWCYGGAEVKGPQFMAPYNGRLVVSGDFEDWRIGINVAGGQRYQIIELDPMENPMEGVNPFRTLVTLEMAKVIDDAVKAEVTRQMQEWAPDERVFRATITKEITRQLRPAIIAAMTRTTWQLNADEAF